MYVILQNTTQHKRDDVITIPIADRRASLKQVPLFYLIWKGTIRELICMNNKRKSLHAKGLRISE